MAEEAVGPLVRELTGCGRAVERPVAGSALPGGHSPRLGFFRVAQMSPFAVDGRVAPFAAPGAEGAMVVEVDEAESVEAMEDEEFCR
jgi:hypothetical protein